MTPHPSLHVVMAVANNPYPQDIRVRNEARALTAAGHRVTVVAPRAPGQRRADTVDGVRVWRYAAPLAVRGAIGYALEFAHVTLATALAFALLRARGPVDVVHLHNPPDTLFLAALPLRPFGARVVFDHHDLAPEVFGAKYERPSPIITRVLRSLEGASVRTADRIVTANDTYRRLDIERHGAQPAHVVTVRNGPPLAMLEASEPDPEVRGRAPFMVGYLGQISRQDGLDHLLRALHHLDVDHGVRDFAAAVVGPAEDADGLRALARDLGIADRVDFMGWRDESSWRSILAAVDVCVVPDPANGLNEHSTMIKTMDYMALGKPVVAYDLPEHRVSAGDAALYAEPNDPAALGARLAELHADPGLGRCLGQRGRERIRDGLAWESSAQRLVELYATARSW